ncbi:hypothetical protein QR680_015924 [Steinernema hermaphroditum]|uniref:Metalloendopeptidase n=1 Tax=Steinernema hermaphroditum TaxID=289476 RepID=A0AA39HAD7_9BILA|nr:hypothetical protein QR680_015924 [Steinernema hermaphroditum]
MLFVLFLLLFASTAYGRRQTRAAVNENNYPERLWQKDRPIPFKFSDDIPEKDRRNVRLVIRSIEQNSCLKFAEVSNANETTIFFKNGTKCLSMQIGKDTSIRLYPIELGEYCRRDYDYFFILVRTLGLCGGHQRPDRNGYVIYDENNTNPNSRQYFDKVSFWDCKDFGVPYDFDSVLHYPPDWFTINESKPNLIAKDPLHQYGMGRNTGPAHSDYLLLNRLYKCPDNCAYAKTKCENSGFVNPNNCQWCICPRGFAGAFCERLDYDGHKDKNCGGYLDAIGSWQELSVERGENQNNISCYWFLRASQGKDVEIQLVTVAPENKRCTANTNTWLEVRLGTFEIGGYKFYCTDQLPKRILRSSGIRTYFIRRRAPWYNGYQGNGENTYVHVTFV